MQPPKISVNFKNIDVQGRIYLNSPSVLGDLYDQGIELVDGLKLVVHDSGWQTEGIVAYSEKDAYYVAVIDWSKLQPPEEEVNGTQENGITCHVPLSIGDIQSRKMKKSAYILSQTDNSFCPKCHQNVYLLIAATIPMYTPSFYICFECVSVGEVGVGIVELFDDASELEEDEDSVDGKKV